MSTTEIDRKIVHTRQQIAEIVERLDRMQEIPNRKLGHTEHMFERARQMLVEVDEQLDEVEIQVYLAASQENNAINYGFGSKSAKKSKKSKKNKKSKTIKKSMTSKKSMRKSKSKKSKKSEKK